jgi:ABC-type multidrug transport system ATPase subunit
LLTTQYLEEADLLAKTVAVIDNGEVIAKDTPAKLKRQLGATVIEMGWKVDSKAVSAEKILSKIVTAPIDREGSLLRLSADGPNVLIEALRELDLKKLPPESLAVREPSLDDVFLMLTGHHAEDAKDGMEEAKTVRARG